MLLELQVLPVAVLKLVEQVVSEAEAEVAQFEILRLVLHLEEQEEVEQYFCTGNYVCNSNRP